MKINIERRRNSKKAEKNLKVRKRNRNNNNKKRQIFLFFKQQPKRCALGRRVKTAQVALPTRDVPVTPPYHYTDTETPF